MSAIPIFFEADDPASERDYIRELRAWLPSQPYDAWLMLVKNMNWDSMDSAADFMIDDPQCDIAVIAFIFWANNPAWRGSTAAYQAACITLNADMPYLGKPSAPSMLGRLRWLRKNLRGNSQFYSGV